jgi:hypothetical protein
MPWRAVAVPFSAEEDDHEVLAPGDCFGLGNLVRHAQNLFDNFKEFSATMLGGTTERPIPMKIFRDGTRP